MLSGADADVRNAPIRKKKKGREKISIWKTLSERQECVHSKHDLVGISKVKRVFVLSGGFQMASVKKSHNMDEIECDWKPSAV